MLLHCALEDVRPVQQALRGRSGALRRLAEADNFATEDVQVPGVVAVRPSRSLFALFSFTGNSNAVLGDIGVVRGGEVETGAVNQRQQAAGDVYVPAGIVAGTFDGNLVGEKAQVVLAGKAQRGSLLQEP